MNHPNTTPRRPGLSRRFLASLRRTPFRPLDWIAAALAVLILAALTASTAQADTINPAHGNAWDFYAFGNGSVVASALNAIALMGSDSAYKALIYFIATVGVITVAIAAGFNIGKNGSKFLGYFFAVYLAVYALVGNDGYLGLRSTIHVTDKISGEVFTVQNVPAVIAVPTSIISVTGQRLTELIEKNFSLPMGGGVPEELKISGSGSFMLAGRLISDAAKVQIREPNLRQSLATYTQDCVIPMMALGQINARELTNSPRLIDAIKSTNQAIMTVYYSPTASTGSDSYGNAVPIGGPDGTVTSCATAYSLIRADVEAYTPEMLKDAAGAWNNTAAMSFLSSAMDSSLMWLSKGNSAIGGADYIKQSAVIELMNAGYAQAAAAADNNELFTALAAEQAKQQQRSQWYMSAEVFKNTVGYLYSVLQVFIFGITPLILAAALIPGFGITILKNYGQITIWLILWSPLLAIVNFLMTAYLASDLANTLNGFDGATLHTLPVITEKTQSMIGAAGFLATLIPVLAYGIVKGSIAFTEFIAAGVGSAFAAGAATAAATGNVALNNQSINNAAMNKADFLARTSVGQGAVQSYNGLGATNSIYEYGGARDETALGQLSGAAEAAAGTGKTAMSTTTAGTREAHQRQVAAEARAVSEISQALRDAAGTRQAGGHTTASGDQWSDQEQAREGFARALVKDWSDTSRVASTATEEGRLSGKAAADLALLVKGLGGDAAAAAALVNKAAGGRGAAANFARQVKAAAGVEGAISAAEVRALTNTRDTTAKDGETATNATGWEHQQAAGKGGRDEYTRTDEAHRAMEAEFARRVSSAWSRVESASSTYAAETARVNTDLLKASQEDGARLSVPMRLSPAQLAAALDLQDAAPGPMPMPTGTGGAFRADLDAARASTATATDARTAEVAGVGAQIEGRRTAEAARAEAAWNLAFGQAEANRTAWSGQAVAGYGAGAGAAAQGLRAMADATRAAYSALGVQVDQHQDRVGDPGDTGYHVRPANLDGGRGSSVVGGTGTAIAAAGVAGVAAEVAGLGLDALDARPGGGPDPAGRPAGREKPSFVPPPGLAAAGVGLVGMTYSGDAGRASDDAMFEAERARIKAERGG